MILMVMTLTTFGNDTTSQTSKYRDVNGISNQDVVLIPDTTKVTMSVVYKDIKSAIVGLSDGLKVGTEKVFVVLIKQQLVIAITDLILLLTFISLTTICFRSFLKYKNYCYDKEHKWYNTNYDAHFEIPLSIILTIIFFIVSISCFISHIDNIITGFVNPEYGAIDRILEMVSSERR